MLDILTTTFITMISDYCLSTIASGAMTNPQHFWQKGFDDIRHAIPDTDYLIRYLNKTKSSAICPFDKDFPARLKEFAKQEPVFKSAINTKKVPFVLMYKGAWPTAEQWDNSFSFLAVERNAFVRKILDSFLANCVRDKKIVVRTTSVNPDRWSIQEANERSFDLAVVTINTLADKYLVGKLLKKKVPICAVLSGGLARISPGLADLTERILESGGCLLTEHQTLLTPTYVTNVKTMQTMSELANANLFLGESCSEGFSLLHYIHSYEIEVIVPPGHMFKDAGKNHFVLSKLALEKDHIGYRKRLQIPDHISPTLKQLILPEKETEDARKHSPDQTGCDGDSGNPR